MNLQEIIDIDLLQKVQDSFAESTGLAAITVDFRGNPITEYSNFSGFCNRIRQDPEWMENCYKCDAYGGLEAARRGTFYMYKCHAGLVDISVPIIVKGQLMGSMLVGQGNVNQKDKAKLDYLIKESSGWQNNPEMAAEFEKIPTSTYEKIKAAAEMMFYVINNMFEKDVMSYVQEELRAKDQQILEQLKVKAELEKELVDKQIQSLQLVINPHFLFNVMNILTCSSIVEKAPKTQEVIVTLSEIMKYILTHYHHLVHLKEELAFIENYLKLQKLRFNDRIRVSITIPEEMKAIKIPPLILQSVLDNAIVHGIEPKDGEGSIDITGYTTNEDYVIEVSDDGVGMSQDKIDRILNGEISSIEQEKQLKGIGLRNIHSILIFHYGNEYIPSITRNRNGGTTVQFRIPKY
ncbi:sensor histidine kinase [Neobacillus sp. Marseille-QA0830]